MVVNVSATVPLDVKVNSRLAALPGLMMLENELISTGCLGRRRDSRILASTGKQGNPTDRSDPDSHGCMTRIVKVVGAESPSVSATLTQ